MATDQRISAEQAPERVPLIVRLAANTAVQAGGTILSSFVSLFTFAAITRYLGPSAFGDLAAATVFLFIPSVLADVGLSAAVLREISQRPDRTERTVNVSLPLRALVALCAMAITVGLSWAVPLHDRTRTAVAIGAIGTFLTLLNLGLVPVLQATLKMHRAAAATLLGRIVTLILTLTVLAAGLGFTAIVWSSVAGAVVTFAVMVLAVGRMVRLRPVVDRAEWRVLLRISVALGVAMGVAQVYFRVDTIILAVLKSAHDVGLYGASYKFVELSQVIGGAVGLSVFPSFALFALDQAETAERLAQKTFDLLVVAGLGFLVVMLTVPRELLGLVAGDEFRSAASAVRLLAAYPLLSFITSLFWWLLVSKRQDRVLVVTSLILLSLNVALNFVFIPTYGFKAAAAISTISEACSLALVMALSIKRGGFRPTLRYSGIAALAAAGMALLTIALPVPALVAAIVAGLAYLALLLAVPGTIRGAAIDIFSGTRAAFSK
jgi:O-antigen/teichoic acid export membrane protein